MFDEMKYTRNLIVAHFKNGKLLKGYTQDFIASKEIFHLTPEHEKEEVYIHEIRTVDLKALFFVKTFEGNKHYVERKSFNDFDTFGLRGLKIKVLFTDGEIIRGMSFDYSKDFKGFNIIPVDPQSNNERIFVLADSLHDIAVGSAAEN